MITARVHLEKLAQSATLLADGGLHVTSKVYLSVEVGKYRASDLVVEAVNTIDSEGRASVPQVGRPRHHSGPWNAAECAARISEYIHKVGATRADWFSGIDGSLMSIRLQFHSSDFQFDLDKSTGGTSSAPPAG